MDKRCCERKLFNRRIEFRNSFSPLQFRFKTLRTRSHSSSSRAIISRLVDGKLSRTNVSWPITYEFNLLANKEYGSVSCINLNTEKWDRTTGDADSAAFVPSLRFSTVAWLGTQQRSDISAVGLACVRHKKEKRWWFFLVRCTRTAWSLFLTKIVIRCLFRRTSATNWYMQAYERVSIQLSLGNRVLFTFWIRNALPSHSLFFSWTFSADVIVISLYWDSMPFYRVPKVGNSNIKLEINVTDSLR